MPSVFLYDTTLRDGAQREGISFSVDDKLKIARRLDDLGIHYVEGGWPGSNPKDAEFFERARSIRFRTARLAAFGATRRAGTAAGADPQVRALLDAGTPVVTIVGKSWDLHVHRVLETTLGENLAMIAETVRHLRSAGREVVFDAEHFFDGFLANPDYALACVRAAADAGTDWIVLCETNGGRLPDEVAAAVERVRAAVAAPLGIHAHNDGELAVANSLAAVQRGATMVQGTINGYGERCGNANLCSIIPNLQLKLGIPVLPSDRLAALTETARYVSEIANLHPDGHQPYVGASAFAHKGGIHVAAVLKAEESYQHVDPALVGNRKRVVVSEVAGRGNVRYKCQELGLDGLAAETAQAVLQQVKRLEAAGYQFEGADASFDLLVRRAGADYRPPFELVDFLVVVETHRRPPDATAEGATLAEAMVKVRVESQVLHTAAEGNGPVNALDAALRKALCQRYPGLAAVRLVDYKVRVLDEDRGTAAQTRVLIESSDGERSWSTVGSSTNIIAASWIALADSLEYWLLTRETGGQRSAVSSQQSAERRSRDS
ncbi:MAG: citramalate synthase [Chloroflexi bacterium]|nr:citramalate synthase [Chloroflexota bacterium]